MSSSQLEYSYIPLFPFVSRIHQKSSCQTHLLRRFGREIVPSSIAEAEKALQKDGQRHTRSRCHCAFREGEKVNKYTEQVQTQDAPFISRAPKDDKKGVYPSAVNLSMKYPRYRQAHGKRLQAHHRHSHPSVRMRAESSPLLERSLTLPCQMSPTTFASATSCIVPSTSVLANRECARCLLLHALIRPRKLQGKTTLSIW